MIYMCTCRWINSYPSFRTTLHCLQHYGHINGLQINLQRQDVKKMWLKLKLNQKYKAPSECGVSYMLAWPATGLRSFISNMEGSNTLIRQYKIKVRGQRVLR